MFRLFRRPDTPQPVVNLPLEDYTAFVRRIAVLEANVEGLELKWSSYLDQMKRLVNRLEKRDERAEKKEVGEPEGEVTPPGTDFRARVLARRRHIG